MVMEEVCVTREKVASIAGQNKVQKLAPVESDRHRRTQWATFFSPFLFLSAEALLVEATYILLTSSVTL